MDLLGSGRVSSQGKKQLERNEQKSQPGAVTLRGQVDCGAGKSHPLSNRGPPLDQLEEEISADRAKLWQGGTKGASKQ